MKKFVPSALLFAFPLALSAAPPEPVYFFDFNTPGKVEASKGSDPSNMVFRTPEKKEGDLHGPAGSGLTGAPADLALDGTAASTMGKEGVGGLASIKGAHLAARSFTVTGWIKAEGDKPVGDGARIVEMVSPEGGFFVFGDATDGTLATIINGNAISGEKGVYGAIGSWIFFAVAYDGESSQITYYIGSPSEPATETGNKPVSAGILADINSPLMLLNSGNFERPFKGWMDNFRLFASANDSSGALSPEQIEEIRKQDLKNP